MTTSRTLFDVDPVPPDNGTPESRSAAQKVLPKTRCDEAAVLAWLQERGRLGATDFEIMRHFGWDGDYTRPRRWRLVKDGKVIKSDTMKRLSPDGNPASVWVVKGMPL